MTEPAIEVQESGMENEREVKCNSGQPNPCFDRAIEDLLELRYAVMVDSHISLDRVVDYLVKLISLVIDVALITRTIQKVKENDL
jgi:hypothetical protein